MRPQGSGFFEWLFTRNTQKFRAKYGLPPVGSSPSVTSMPRSIKPVTQKQMRADDNGFLAWLGIASIFGGAVAGDSVAPDAQPQDLQSIDPPSCDPL